MHGAMQSARVITLRVGGVTIRFEAVDPNIVMSIAFPRTLFTVPEDAEYDCRVRVRLGPVEIGPDAPVFGSGGPWELRRGIGGGDSVSFWTQLSDTEREPTMRLDLNAGLDAGELVVEPRYSPGAILQIGYPLDEYLTARLLARRGAVVLHASAVAEGEHAYVFAGHSGVGKSTIAEIAGACGAEVLSDDRTVLFARDGAVMAAGTPWHGSLASGSPAEVKVRAILLLEQASGESVEPMGRARAFAELMVRVVRPTAELAEQIAVVDALQEVVRRVPVATLRFRPRVEALEVVRRYVAGAPYARSDRASRASLTR
jgi:hypothetical protein